MAELVLSSELSNDGYSSTRVGRQLAKETIRRRKLVKSWTPTVLFAVGGAICFFFGLDFLEVAKGIFGGIAAAIDQIGIRLEDWPALRFVANVVVGGSIGASVAWLLDSFSISDRLFPDPPSFVFGDIADERVERLLDTPIAPPPFVGRANELAMLKLLLEQTGKGQPFIFRTITGPSGIGKTRLALEWLDYAHGLKFDVGVIDPYALDEIEEWKARRPTALLLDEADSFFYRQQVGSESRLMKILRDLRAATSEKSPVVLLLTGQANPWDLAQHQGALGPKLSETPTRLEPLEEMAELATLLAEANDADAQAIERESAGRPRHAIIMAQNANAQSYSEALNITINRALNALSDGSGAIDSSEAVGLICAAFVGPIETSDLTAHFEQFDPRRLERFFARAAPDELMERLPRLMPPDAAEIMALRLLDRLPPGLQTGTVVPFLIEQDPDQIEERLQDIWEAYPHFVPSHRHYPESGAWDHGMARALNALQTAFDEKYRDRLNAMVEANASFGNSFRDYQTPEVWSNALARMDQWARRRPDVDSIAHNLFVVAGNLLGHVTDDIERNYRLEAFNFVEPAVLVIQRILLIRNFLDYEALHRQFARVLNNAITAAAEAAVRGFEVDWDRVEALADSYKVLIPDSNPGLIQNYCRVPISVIHFLGASVFSGDENRLQRAWGSTREWLDEAERILAVAEGQSTPASQLSLSQAYMNAMKLLIPTQSGGVESQLGEINGLVERFDNLLSDEMVRENKAVREIEAIFINNAIESINGCSTIAAGDKAEHVDRLIERFDRLRALPMFQDSVHVARVESILISNSLPREVANGNTAKVLWWEKRLDTLAKHAVFSEDLGIARARVIALEAALRALMKRGDGLEQKLSEAAERWLRGLAQLLDDPAFGRDEMIEVVCAEWFRHAVHLAGTLMEDPQAERLHYDLFEEKTEAMRQFLATRERPISRLMSRSLADAVSCAMMHMSNAIAKGLVSETRLLEFWSSVWTEWVVSDPDNARDLYNLRQQARLVENIRIADTRLADSHVRTLAISAQLYPFDPVISELSHKNNLSIADQEAQNWPYGQVKSVPGEQYLGSSFPSPTAYFTALLGSQVIHAPIKDRPAESHSASVENYAPSNVAASAIKFDF